MSTGLNMSTGLKLTYSDMQAETARLAERFCAQHSTPENVRALMGTETGYDEAVWAEMAGLGLCGLAIDAAHGGAGLGVAELVPVLEQMGRRLMAGPYLDTVLAGLLIARTGSAAQKENWLRAICGGRNFALGFAEAGAEAYLEGTQAKGRWQADHLVLSGEKCLLAFAASVDFILVHVRVDGTPALAVVERANLPDGALRKEDVIDETMRSFSLSLDGLDVARTDVIAHAELAAHLEEHYLAANLLNTARMCGGARAALDLSVDYASTRIQFGRPIGSYQAIKHTLVDVWISYEKARSLLYAAACARESDRERAVRMARIKAEAAFAFAADRAIQYHGAFGFTHECDAGLYRRRALYCAALYDNAQLHKRQLATSMFQG